MWTHDVGKDAAANYPVLRDIFEANLELLEKEERNRANLEIFSQKALKKFIFLIRDFCPEEGIDE